MPKTFDDDPLAFPHLVGLLEELKSVMEDLRMPAPCTAAVVPGQAAAMDYLGDECDTFAWTRLAQIYPSLAFPEPDARPAAALVTAAIVEIGVMRTLVLPDNGEAADPAELYEVTRTQTADMRAMLQAMCQYGSKALDDRIVIQAYSPLGPAGGVVGGVWTAIMPQAF